MEKEYFKASEDLQLLRDWSNNRHDPKEYEKNEQRARKAAARLFNSGVLVFERGDKPRTASEFFDCLPYTSTSDFAAVWDCSYQISRLNDRALHFVGIALSDCNAVAVWERFDANGYEIGTEYEIIK